MMRVPEFVSIVATMRSAQKEAEQYPSPLNAQVARGWEQKVDELVTACYAGRRPRDMFTTEKEVKGGAR